MKILPNQIPAYRTAGEAWEWAMRLFQDAPLGHKPLWSENTAKDGKLTREILNLQLPILNPLDDWPFPGSWNMTTLNQYALQLLDFSYDCKGFDYMYNERMGRQKFYIIKLLKSDPNTREATMYLWIPEKDLETDLHKPCQIVADYKLRDDKLNATHVFRSHDIKGAWPQNVYGLAQLQKQIADEVGCETGILTTISASAHIYQV